MRKKEECAKTKIRLLFYLFLSTDYADFTERDKINPCQSVSSVLKEIIKWITPSTGEEAYIHR